MPEDVTKEIAATSEPPDGKQTRGSLASEEFFFLLQRIDRLDEKLSGEIKALDEKLSGEIKTLDEKLSGEIRILDGKITALDGRITALNEKISNKLNNLGFWVIGIIITLIVGFAGIIVALAFR